MKSSSLRHSKGKSLVSRRSSPIHDTFDHGLSNLELVALQKAWRMLEPKLRKLSTDIIMDLYSEHYEIMDKFRDEDGKLCNYELINHSIWLLHLYGSIINNKVDPFKTKKILEPLIEKLKMYSMDVNSVNLQLDCTKKYIFSELRNSISPTSVEAFSKLNQTIVKYVHKKLN
ncbi:uncharacterized protein LOC105216124 isoform X2 [Zeugodacus cucurbitae]|uniref:Myoglobin n=1 Tax=Zeugodacus cucurbitae TaxID=28588 RepID=A0A0A1XK17_ZEUCU|nr:uncharacterized protein LOC105216124 isoform X2 [Zeugodacus cucurbitae]